MEKATIIGVDLAKNVFQMHGAAADGTVLFRMVLTRLQFHRFIAEQPACLAEMEACGGAHYWAREMRVSQAAHRLRQLAALRAGGIHTWAPSGGRRHSHRRARFAP